ncbi:hypothetical protein A2U01_0086657, partial [Trifolium medium]|nr:hypothetical protein [Trifolium medium]
KPPKNTLFWVLFTSSRQAPFLSVAGRGVATGSPVVAS